MLTDSAGRYPRRLTAWVLTHRWGRAKSCKSHGTPRGRCAWTSTPARWYWRVRGLANSSSLKGLRWTRGDVWVSDTLNHRIQVFDLDGTLLREISEYGGAAG